MSFIHPASNLFTTPALIKVRAKNVMHSVMYQSVSFAWQRPTPFGNWKESRRFGEKIDKMATFSRSKSKLSSKLTCI